MDISGFGKILIGIGMISIIIGLVFILGGRLGLGRLPGDIFLKKGNFIFYFPIITCIIISIILTIIFNLLSRR